MKLSRTEAREKIMVILYQIDFYIKNNIEYNVEDVIKENIEIDNTFIRNVVYGVLEHLEDIDNIISKYLENWDLDRLGKTDKAILRMGVFEMLYFDTPEVVAINESIELSKKYSDDKIVSLVNAVLDKVRDEEIHE